MDDTLLSSPTSLSIAELLIVNRQLLDQIPSLLARLDQVEAENRELRRETAILKCEVGYWKSRHADALLRIPEKDRLIESLQAEIKQLKSRQFGRRTEKSSKGSRDRSNTLPGEMEAVSQPARKRGRQTGQQAPQRRGYEHLPVVAELIVLPAEQCLCDKCGAPRMAQGTEDSEQIEIEVQAHRRKFRRQRYRRSCQCPDEPVTSIAPLPEKLLPKGILGTSVFVDVLISKYQVHQPVERWLLEWRQNDLDLAKGTVFDGLRRIEPLLAPIHQAILQRAATAEVSQADETRWLMFAEVEVDAESNIPTPTPNTLRVSPFDNVPEAEPYDSEDAIKLRIKLEINDLRQAPLKSGECRQYQPDAPASAFIRSVVMSPSLTLRVSKVSAIGLAPCRSRVLFNTNGGEPYFGNSASNSGRPRSGLRSSSLRI